MTWYQVGATPSPEPDDDIYYISLHSIAGDAAVYYTPYVAMTIMANDHANGIFKFGSPSLISIMEGEQASFL